MSHQNHSVVWTFKKVTIRDIKLIDAHMKRTPISAATFSVSMLLFCSWARQTRPDHFWAKSRSTIVKHNELLVSTHQWTIFALRHIYILYEYVLLLLLLLLSVIHTLNAPMLFAHTGSTYLISKEIPATLHARTHTHTHTHTLPHDCCACYRTSERDCGLKQHWILEARNKN